jgi:dCMP deaminase
MGWDEYFLALCAHVARKSKDRSTRVGCVVVGPDHEIRSTGFNGFPRGCDDSRESWHERPLKYKVTEHAERNAIYNAARCGTPLKGCTLYVPWRPCADCARGVIQSGIVEVVMDPDHVPDPALLERWKEDHAAALMMFMEARVVVRYGEKPTSKGD